MKKCNFLYRGHADHHFLRRDGGNRSVHSGGWTMPFRNTATSARLRRIRAIPRLPTAAQTRRTTRQTARMRLLTPLLTRLRPIPQTQKRLRSEGHHPERTRYRQRYPSGSGSGRRLPYRIRGRNPGRLRHQQPVRRHELGTEGHSSASDRQGALPRLPYPSAARTA